MKKSEMKRLFKGILSGQLSLSDNESIIRPIIEIYISNKPNSIWVQKSKKWNNMQFCTEFGTFSYIKAVDFYFGKKESPEDRFKQAMRRHLHPIMMEFKKNNMPEKCPHTGIELNFKNCHVDHTGPFEFDDIISSYIDDIDLSHVEYQPTDDGDLFVDEIYLDDFLIIHGQLAELEVVHASHNLTRGK